MMNGMNYRVIIFLFIILSSCNLEQEGKQQVKVTEPFNSNWKFLLDSEDQGNWANGLPEGGMTVNIPHTWNTIPGFEEFAGTGWYEKELTIANDWINKPVYLQFGAVYRDVTIWLNGKQILDRVGLGYTPFKVKLTDNLVVGHNRIVLRVSNRFSDMALPYRKMFDWPNDGGIIRKVKLIKSEAPSIHNIQLTPILIGKKGRITVKLILNEENYRRVSLWVRVQEENQKTKEIVFDGNFKIKVYDKEGIATIDIPKVKAWHFDQPNLYKVEIALGYGNKLTDSYITNTGFRELKAVGNKIVFNGETVRLPGIEWMPGSNPDFGMAEPEEEMHHMLEMMKDVNAVFTRFHWQQDEAIFDWCDRNGILVQEEIPFWQGPYPNHLNDSLKQIISMHCKEMIAAHYNHPSIVAWGIGNELQGQDEEMKSYLMQLVEEIQSLDTTRLINYVSNSMHHNPTQDAASMVNWPGWNDYSGYWYQRPDGTGLSEDGLNEMLLSFHDLIPDKPIMISEYGLCEPRFKGGDPERIRHFLFHTNAYDDKPFIGGVIYFSLNDYRTHIGEEGIGRFRRRVHGIVDIEGNKKPSYQVVKDRFSPIRNLFIEKRENNIHIRGEVADGLPSYILRGYFIQAFDIDKNIIGDPVNLPDLKTGDPFNQIIRSIDNRFKGIWICRPNGNSVSEVKL